MPSAHPSLQVSRWCIVAAFMVALWLPIIQRPAQYPACFYDRGGGSLQAVPFEESERRFLDLFPRQGLFAVHDRLRLALFGLLPRTVIKGSGGWLFYRSEAAHDGDTMDDLLGRSQPSAGTVARWLAVMERRKAWCAGQGLAYAVMVAPNKQTLHGDLLPIYFRRQPHQPPTRLDQVSALLPSSGRFLFIDLRDPLAAARRREQVYFRTDTHWNDVGALVADSAAVTRLKLLFTALAALKRDDFREQEEERSGDIAALAHASARFRERAVRLVPSHDFPARGPDGQLLLAAGVVPSTPLPISRYDADVVACDNPTAPAPTALVFHDSFGLGLMPYLAQHFRHTVFVRKRFDPAVVAAEKPQLIIDVVAERYLERLFADAELPPVP